MKKTTRRTDMTHVKRLAASLLVGGLAAFVPAIGHAFTSAQISTNTAVATVTGGSVAMTVAIRKVSDNSSDTQLNWTSISAGSGWVASSNYIQIDSTLTVQGSGIQTYTDNMAADASP